MQDPLILWLKSFVPLNMYRTAIGVCTENEEREESCMLASQIASLKDYVPRQRRADRTRQGHVTNSPESKATAFHFD